MQYVVSPPLTDEALNALFAASWKQHKSIRFSYLRAHSLGWIAALDSLRLVGFVNVAWDGLKHGFLLDTTVHPDYQRLGIGSELVGRAVTLAGARGIEWLHVDYEPELAGFYRGCGFRGTDAGVMRVPLPLPPHL